MNLQCQRHEYASGTAFSPLFGANNGIPPCQIQRAQHFQFPQLSNLLQTNLFDFSTGPFICKSLFLCIKKAEKSTPQLQECFLCLCLRVCVCVCVGARSIMCSYYFDTRALLKAL
jgi:hypothetical protein